MDTPELKNLQKLVDSHEEIRKQRSASGISVLTGNQWIVVQEFERSYKILGYDKENVFISGTVDYFESRMFCGIVYYDEKTAQEIAEKLNAREESKWAPFKAFNPYQSRF